MMWKKNFGIRYGVHNAVQEIIRFQELMGETPCYMDGHQHVHLYPSLAETIASVMQEFGISKTRFPSEDMDEVSWMNTHPRKMFRQQVYENVGTGFRSSVDSRVDSHVQKARRLRRFRDWMLAWRDEHDDATRDQLLSALSPEPLGRHHHRVYGASWLCDPS